MVVTNIAAMIDHTLLKADATKKQIETLCQEARDHKFFSVCVNPAWVSTAKELLNGSGVKICTVIGFPLGATTTETKAFETKNVIDLGADEVDMVIPIGALKDGNDQLVEQDIRAVVEVAKDRALTKVIIETSLLTDEEKKRACELAVKAGADFVKTSTGFSGGGATAEDIALMRQTVGPNIGVKASGGVRSTQDALSLMEAGATRIGASASVAIIKGEQVNSNY
ncbi:deoxyribose-phosphate aldolase [Bacillus sp. AFS076308]|uniref:deoxyribose-phosphate aldolase n=1 Tax=unclassified Bacillus (in: firmicutes) TaxID=185979 RepID=UPI000BF8B2C3|nr:MULTISPECIES: deoxyribose-phosphate aldolase [unclassified Bacillus (in: firmicutes)]PFO03664.1 deoxyribose-phosphate aldolase [Bacillus sp. AFS076308]PGV54395.1 deoxyribose-phosphate aldolase [Bacillus sp. AFS037270]